MEARAAGLLAGEAGELQRMGVDGDAPFAGQGACSAHAIEVAVGKNKSARRLVKGAFVQGADVGCGSGNTGIDESPGAAGILDAEDIYECDAKTEDAAATFSMSTI